jgi:hypothetical protein
MRISATPSLHTLEVGCTVDIAQTSDTLHAHVTLDGCEPGPGDTVQVHDAPTVVAFGEHLVCEREATVRRAGWIARGWTRLASWLELAELYEVGFSGAGRPARPPGRLQ